MSPLLIGATIQVSSHSGQVTATVVSYTRSGSVQMVTATDSMGAIHRLAIDLDQDTEDGSEVVDINYARQLAIQVLGGHRHRMPVSQEANILADAVIALTGGSAASCD